MFLWVTHTKIHDGFTNHGFSYTYNIYNADHPLCKWHCTKRPSIRRSVLVPKRTRELGTCALRI